MPSVLRPTECTQYDTQVSCSALPKLRLESHGFMRVLWDFSALTLAPAQSWDCYGPSGKAGIVLSFHRCVAEGHLLLLIDQHCRCCSSLAGLALGGSWWQEFEHGLQSCQVPSCLSFCGPPCPCCGGGGDHGLGAPAASLPEAVPDTASTSGSPQRERLIGCSLITSLAPGLGLNRHQ